MRFRFFKKHAAEAALCVVIAVGISLVLTAAALTARYSEEITGQSSARAELATAEAVRPVAKAVARYTEKAVNAAGAVSGAQTRDDLYDRFGSLLQTDGYRDASRFAFFKDGVLYDGAGNEYGGDGPMKDAFLTFKDTAAYLGTWGAETGGGGRMSTAAFYAPVYGSPACDAIVICYARSVLQNAFAELKGTAGSEFSIVCTSSGEILAGWDEVGANDVLDALRSLSGEKAPVDRVARLLSRHGSGTVSLSYLGEDYLVSVGSDADVPGISVVELYEAETLASSDFDFLRTVTAVLILFAAISAGLIGYLVFNRFRLRKKLLGAETRDGKYGCYNRLGFEREAGKILERNRSSFFAVVSLRLRHYKRLLDDCGEEKVGLMTSHMRSAAARVCGMEETYGYAGRGQFLLLLHDTDRGALLERLKIHAFLCTDYAKKIRVNAMLKYGVYEIERGDGTAVSQMIEYADESSDAGTGAMTPIDGMQIGFYSNEEGKIRLAGEEMELRMDAALQNGEFRVFYQPKFNLSLGRQDGCEALVRWYDPEKGEYYRPELFMPLFETDGFVVKLDKYVYTKVCEHLADAAAHGGRVYPVSVNVSRLTALQDDFVDYYARIKRKFGIGDGLLTVEFTESFACENYPSLYAIVGKLRQRGFRCSIDDFGCGYSSYRILKSLPVDELKLDRFFLEKSESPERDRAVLGSIVSMAKELGMKVTQEGVETYEDVLKLKEIGCDVVQGYYYARPMPESDYIRFTASSAEHDIALPEK